MKPLRIIHTVITFLLFGLVMAAVALMLTGTVEVRLPNQAQGQRHAIPEIKTRLLVVHGAKPNMEYPVFEGQNFLGRADEKPVDIDLQIQESPDRIWSSRQHAVITCEKESLFIEDMNSSNGTYVNRGRIQPGQKQALKKNDIIQIGEVQLKVL
jgi:hypothetical protein